MNLHYAIVGAGAIGGFVGAHLKNIGKQVSFLARSNFNTLRQQGLTIEQPQSVLQLTDLDVYHAIDAMPKCDVVILATKTTSNAEMIFQLPQLLTNNGVIIILQNGIGYEERLAKYISDEQIIGATIALKVNQAQPGRIKHYGLSDLALAGYNNTKNHVPVSPLLQEIANDFNKTGIQTEVNENLAHIRWKKLVRNIPGNGLCVVLDSTIQALYDNPHSFELISHIASEVTNIANHCGAELSLEKMMAALQQVREAKIAAYPSLKEDYDSGKELELEAIYENPLAIAQRYHQQMPLTHMLYQQLCFLQQLRSSKANLSKKGERRE